jgi:hypothetical protein
MFIIRYAFFSTKPWTVFVGLFVMESKSEKRKFNQIWLYKSHESQTSQWSLCIVGYLLEPNIANWIYYTTFYFKIMAIENPNNHTFFFILIHQIDDFFPENKHLSSWSWCRNKDQHIHMYHGKIAIVFGNVIDISPHYVKVSLSPNLTLPWFNIHNLYN